MMKKIVFSLMIVFTSLVEAQIGIGTTTPNASAILDITSTSKGLLLPRLTTTQRDAIASPVSGLMVFNTTTNKVNIFVGAGWDELNTTATYGSIATLDCAGATNAGTMNAGTAASGVTSTIAYTGGNGLTHNGQVVTSTGVTGLTATLAAGIFASGNGTLVYTITGTPATNGTATFALSIGGQSCTLSLTVDLQIGTISTINCGGATNNGTLFAGSVSSGVSSVISYTGGNAGIHNGQIVTSTGVTGLTATLTSGVFASGNGALSYSITGTPTSIGTASFAINIGGKTCTLTRTVDGPTIGNTYQGGTIGYIFQSGDVGYVSGEIHGIIVKSSFTSDHTNSGCGVSSAPGIATLGASTGSASTSIGSGLQNTIALYSTSGETSISVAYNYTDGTYSDWFLPSKDELYQVLTNLAYGPSRNNFGFGTSSGIRSSSANPLNTNQTYAYSVTSLGSVTETFANAGGCWRYVICRYF